MPIRTPIPVPAPPPGAPPLVLLAVGEPGLRAQVHADLAAYARVVETADGRAALDAARTLGPHLVVADAALPGLDGVALCAALKGEPKTALAPVFLLCDSQKESHRLAAYRAGASACLPRPPEAALLQARVEGALAERERLLRREAELDARAIGLMSDGEEEAADPFLRRMDAAIAARLHDPDLTLRSLADGLNLSARQLQRRLAELSVGSVGERIRDARLARANVFLATGRTSVRAAAEAVGFRSASAFAAAFRTRYGMAPSAVALLARKRQEA